MLAALAQITEYVVSGAADLEKLRDHPAGYFTFTADVIVPDTFVPILKFSGEINGHGWMLQLASEGRLAGQASGAIFRNLVLHSPRRPAFEIADGFMFKNVQIIGRAAEQMRAGRMISCSVAYQNEFQVQNSYGTSYCGSLVRGNAGFIKNSENDRFYQTLFEIHSLNSDSQVE